MEGLVVSLSDGKDVKPVVAGQSHDEATIIAMMKTTSEILPTAGLGRNAMSGVDTETSPPSPSK